MIGCIKSHIKDRKACSSTENTKIMKLIETTEDINIILDLPDHFETEG